MAARSEKQCGLVRGHAANKRDDHMCFSTEVRYDSGMRYRWRHVWPPLQWLGASHVGMWMFYHSGTTISSAPKDLREIEADWEG